MIFRHSSTTLTAQFPVLYPLHLFISLFVWWYIYVVDLRFWKKWPFNLCIGVVMQLVKNVRIVCNVCLQTCQFCHYLCTAGHCWVIKNFKNIRHFKIIFCKLWWFFLIREDQRCCTLKSSIVWSNSPKKFKTAWNP